ncbi:hypothetical protein [Bosea sp. NPDC055594]
MLFTPLALEFDRRISGFCVTARADYEWFLRAAEDSLENLEIQRKIISGTKAYATLRADIRRGCVLPPLVLAANNVTLPVGLDRLRTVWSQREEQSLLESLTAQLNGLKSTDVQIIDGLQRTNALLEIRSGLKPEELDEFNARHLRFEIWLNLPFQAIAYRMLLLNAGQKPMSMKHQIEILSRGLKEDLSGIPRMEIISSKDNRRRVSAGQFHLAKIAQMFQAWLQGSPNIDIANSVMEELLADSAISTLGLYSASEQTHNIDTFKNLMEWTVEADHFLASAVPPIPDALQFFGNDTVLLGIAAAVGRATDVNAVELLRTVIQGDPHEDPLGTQMFARIRTGINPSKRNVGAATRELVFHTFRQFFLNRGQSPLRECWELAGNY